MARSAADAAAMLGAIAGPDIHDPTTYSAAVPEYLETLGDGARGLRIGVDRGYATDDVDAQVAAALGEAERIPNTRWAPRSAEPSFHKPDEETTMDLGLKGLNAVVTGGSKRIGRSAADILADEGVNLAICARNPAEVAGAIGILVERTIIRWLYGRMIDTMLATWGLSLFLVGLTTTVFGNTTVGLSAPLGSFEIGSYRVSGYTLFVIAVAIVTLGRVLAGDTRVSGSSLAARCRTPIWRPPSALVRTASIPSTSPPGRR